MVTPREREIIRELAKQVRDIGQRPETQKKIDLWKAHNDLETADPVVSVFPEGSWHECVTADSLECEDEEARKIEWLLKARIFRANVIQDDVPVTNIWEVSKIITDTGWDKTNPNHTNDTFTNEMLRDNCLGGVPYVWKHGFKFDGTAGHFHPSIEEPEELSKLGTPAVTYHEKETMETLALHQDLLGDILDVRLVGLKFLYFAMVETYADFRGLEQVMYDIYEEPEMLHEAMCIMEEGYHGLLDQYMEMGLLTNNGGQGYSGSGGLTYTKQLPDDDAVCTDLKNFFGMTESQEFTMVGPDQHWEFVQVHEKAIADRFGLSAYGCCEPVENKLKNLKKFETLRRISVSPWADRQSCSDQMGMDYVYSWKPNPSYYINNYTPENTDLMEKYVKETLNITKYKNPLEIVLKDTHTCQNDPMRFGAWVKDVRRWIEETR